MQVFADISGSYSGLGAYVAFLVIGTIVFGALILVLLPGLVVAALARKQAEKIANERVDTIIAQYEPPQGFSPAEMGLLYDMHCSKTEVMATLFDLEQRGIVTIEPNESVTVINQAAYASLKEYEKIAVRSAKGETVALSHPVKRSIQYVDPQTGEQKTFTMTLPAQKSLMAFTNAVQKAITDKGIKMNNYYLAFVGRTLLVACLLALLPMLLAGLPGTYNGEAFTAWSAVAFGTAVGSTLFLGFFLFPVYILASVVIVWLWTRVAGRYWLNSKQARAVWPELEGYRRFLSQVDIDNIQFESGLTGEHSPLTKSMPYAMVFGLETKWQQRLKNRVTPDTV